MCSVVKLIERPVVRVETEINGKLYTRLADGRVIWLHKRMQDLLRALGVLVEEVP